VANATASDAFPRGCLLAKGTADLSKHDPTVAAAARPTSGAIEELSRCSIARGQRSGGISQDADPHPGWTAAVGATRDHSARQRRKHALHIVGSPPTLVALSPGVSSASQAAIRMIQARRSV
jgi:hypothetical protein